MNEPNPIFVHNYETTLYVEILNDHTVHLTLGSHSEGCRLDLPHP
jgi:hypothetical protein